MSLTTGRGPLSRRPAGRFNEPLPDGLSYIEPYRRRVRALLGGNPIVDSDRVLLVHRPGAPPTYAVPAGDVRAVEGVAEPLAPGYVTVPWAAADAWYEEDEEVFGHPRNPYHRVDCLPTHRHLRVEVGGTLLIDTADTVAVFETALEPRLYVGREHLLHPLEPSATTTYCPYKGTASHFTAVIGGRRVPDIAWSYEDPYPACGSIRGCLSFYDPPATVVTELPAPPPGEPR